MTYKKMKTKEDIRETLIHIVKTYHNKFSTIQSPEKFIDTYYSDFKEWLLK